MKSVNLTKFWEGTRKIVCVGRNYADHAKGNAVPTAPFFFLKPTSAFILPGNAIEVPPKCEVHHEVELAVIIGKKGRDIPLSQAMDFVYGYTLALDMTARNLQQQAKEKGLPWTQAKGYDTFCPIVDKVIPKEKIDPQNVELYLKVDGVLKQKGSTRDMIFNVPTLISHFSSVMTLEPGDLLLTGTPSGVGPVLSGQVIEVGITGVLEGVKFPVIARPTAKL